jgi:CheY-like chemotaxis protein
VRGLDLGADDYLTKPFSVTEFGLAFARCCGELGHHRRGGPWVT